MERIAFIAGSHFITWSSVVITLAAAAAACIFLGLYLWKSGNSMSGFAAVPLALALSLAAARLIHWYCYEESYESLHAAMTNFSQGGYALLGAFAGCLLAALLLRLVRLSRNLPEMLDCMCLAGSAGIAIGRLSSFFNSTDRGQMVDSIRSMPWVYPVTNVTSGTTEYRLATFLLQAMVAGLIFLILAVFYLARKNRSPRDGDTTLLFLLFYGGSQIMLDSTRYDSMFFRSNGFVSIVQVFGALALAFAIILFSVRLVKNQGFRKWYLILWAVTAALIGCAGYMEYYVQRHGNEAVFAYTLMGTSLLLVMLLTVGIRYIADHSLDPLLNKIKKTGCP